MNEEMLRTIERTGQAAPTLIDAGRALVANAKRIEAERYRPDKEREEILKAQQALVAQIQQYEQQDLGAAAAERDRDMKALEAEILERVSIPRKRSDELDAEYNGRLLRRHIEETRRMSALMLALADVQAIGMASDPALVVAAVDEALTTKAAPEAISRIGRAAESKLQAMAAEETRNGQPGPAFEAYTLVGNKLRTWRAGGARESVEARRDQILARHTLRTMNTRNSVLAVARACGVEELFKRAALKAAVQSETER